MSSEEIKAVEDRTRVYLIEKGCNPKQCGFEYMVDVIVLIVEDWRRASALWGLYDRIGQKFGKTAKAVDKNIRYTVIKSGNKDVARFLILSADKIRLENK